MERTDTQLDQVPRLGYSHSNESSGNYSKPDTNTGPAIVKNADLLKNNYRSNETTGKYPELDEIQTGPDIVKNADVIETISLKKAISLFSATALLIASTGGGSVFIAPTSILKYAGSPGVSLIFWLVGGLINFGLTFCFIEVALLFPKAGGPYFYIKEVFGSFFAFVFLWGFVLFICAPAWALGAYIAALYTTTVLFPDCTPPETATKFLAAWIMVTLIVLNCLYTKYVTRVQSFLSACKLVAMGIVIVGGLSSLGSTSSEEHLNAMFRGSTTDVGNVALGLAAGYFSFGGWQVITLLIEEVEKPLKNVPRALTITFFVVITLYVFVNFCYFIVLSPQDILMSDAVAVLFAYHIHPALAVIISVLVSLCAVSGLNVLILGQPRMIYAAGKEGQLPALIAMINKKYFTPWPATFLLGVPALIVLVSGTVMSLIDTMSLYANLMIISVLLCLIRLRWTHPEAKRPFKVPLVVPIVELAVSVVVVVLSVLKKPRQLGMCIAVVAAGIPVYIVFVKWKSKPVWFTSLVDKWTVYFQILFNLEAPGS